MTRGFRQAGPRLEVLTEAGTALVTAAAAALEEAEREFFAAAPEHEALVTGLQALLAARPEPDSP